jgi:hypothetical protein
VPSQVSFCSLHNSAAPHHAAHNKMGTFLAADHFDSQYALSLPRRMLDKFQHFVKCCSQHSRRESSIFYAYMYKYIHAQLKTFLHIDSSNMTSHKMVVFSTQVSSGNILLHGYNKQKMADSMMEESN